MKLETKKLGKFWYITGDDSAGLMGPYNTPKEAEEDRKRIVKFYRHREEPGWLSSDRTIQIPD